MKKIIIASLALTGALGSLNVSAANTDICDGAGVATAPQYNQSGNFMVSAIAPKCSANVYVKGGDGTNGSFYSVGSASKKGKTPFAGTTNGGSVGPGAACAVAGGCTADEAETARTTAASKATPST